MGTIRNDDSPPTITIGDVSVDEGAGVAVFQVVLSAPSGITITVKYATAKGTAASPGDFQAVAGTLTFAAGTTLMTIRVPIVDDSLYEGNETFKVNLSAAANAKIQRNAAVCTIVDNDPKPALSLAGAAVKKSAVAAADDQDNDEMDTWLADLQRSARLRMSLVDEAIRRLTRT